MAVASVARWRVKEGKQQEFAANVAKGKKILERLGGDVRVWQTMFGPEPGSVGVVVSHEDMKAYGEFASKLQADSEWQEFVAEILAKPSGELISNSLISEVQGI